MSFVHPVFAARTKSDHGHNQNSNQVTAPESSEHHIALMRARWDFMSTSTYPPWVAPPICLAVFGVLLPQTHLVTFWMVKWAEPLARDLVGFSLALHCISLPQSFDCYARLQWHPFRPKHALLLYWKVIQPYARYARRRPRRWPCLPSLVLPLLRGGRGGLLRRRSPPVVTASPSCDSL